MAKRPRLGRGLDAMLPAAPKKSSDNFSSAIEDVHPNKDQPRTHFDEAALEALSASIAELGVLEPILVRKRKRGGFEIIAGERRWRAAQRAGLKEVPVFVRELSEKHAFEAALVENLQREDLNPIETARAFQRLCDEYSHTQETVAKRIGKDRSTIANALRLLKLPPEILQMVEGGRLSEGHGRALLRAPDVRTMKKLAHQVADGALSVRETERRARSAAKEVDGKVKKKLGRSPNVKDLETRLGRELGTRVAVSDRNGKGKLEIRYGSYDELDRIIEQLLN